MTSKIEMTDSMDQGRGDSTVKTDFSKAPVVLDVEHVSKYFKLPTEQATGLKQAFVNWTRGIKGYTKQHVLKDITFQVHQGEFFGIVGRNGGGNQPCSRSSPRFTTRNRARCRSKANWSPSLSWAWASTRS